jgi:hypothetical protein
MKDCSWRTGHYSKDGADRSKSHRARTQHEVRRVSLTGQCEAAGAGVNGAPNGAGALERIQTGPTAGLPWGR